MSEITLSVSPAVVVPNVALPNVVVPNQHSWNLQMAYGMTPLASDEPTGMTPMAATFPDGTPMAAPEPKEDDPTGMTPMAATFPDGTPMAAPEPKEDDPVSTPMIWKRYMAPYSPTKNPILGAPKKEPLTKTNPFSFSSNPTPCSDEYNPDDEKYYVPVSRELKFTSKYEEEVYTWANKVSLPRPLLECLKFDDLPPLSSAPFTRSPKNFHNSTPMAS